jgi:hypothetical protein
MKEKDKKFGKDYVFTPKEVRLLEILFENLPQGKLLLHNEKGELITDAISLDPRFVGDTIEYLRQMGLVDVAGGLRAAGSEAPEDKWIRPCLTSYGRQELMWIWSAKQRKKQEFNSRLMGYALGMVFTITGALLLLLIKHWTGL